VVDVCGGECRYTVRLEALPYYPEFDAEVTAPLGSGEWHYFNLVALVRSERFVAVSSKLAVEPPDHGLDGMIRAATEPSV